ncbi:hypothetical protein KIN20_033855 [Parelaphostrongylus tenuis]|uniref:Uncharacterized protein n=1 Tax=Parelaphostrongylus tenuis TaxID=148309 RepID=A0AAD5WJ75_PARTN|nr:hypothetical protein KIN20_033855 [Parelaphostrongylus tenuis]
MEKSTIDQVSARYTAAGGSGLQMKTLVQTRTSREYQSRKQDSRPDKEIRVEKPTRIDMALICDCVFDRNAWQSVICRTIQHDVSYIQETVGPRTE